MNLHELTSKSELPEHQPETILPEPASESILEPVADDLVPEVEKDVSLSMVSMPEELATEGEENMTTDSPPADQENVHDVVFWEVHVIVGYYIVASAFTAWLLLNVWGGNLLILRSLGLTDQAIADPFLRTVGYTVVGSIFGSILYNIRVLYYFYLIKKTYDRRWFGKYISAPWESAAMSLVVLALVRGGAALFGGTGGTAAAPPSPTDNFAAMSMGALVGFGMRDVVRWVQSLVETTFGALAKDKTTTKE